MKISIVTVSYNQAKFLQEALNSVLDQSFSAIEYIVVDPGSVDGSREIIMKYKDRLAQTIFELDTGAADGLNKGFKHATGDIYGFLNSDDKLLPGALQKVADCFNRNPNFDIVMGDGFITDEHGVPIRHVKATSFTPMRLVYGGTTSLQQSTFFSRRAFDGSGGFNTNNATCWDIELFLNMVQWGAKIIYLHSDLSYFRIHANSITGTDRVATAYKLDRERMFHEVQDRPWRRTDDLMTLYFKSLRFLADPTELIATFKTRLRGASC